MKKCMCRECGTTWMKGEMGDNEEICYRCEHESIVEDMDDAEYEEYDRRNSEQE